MPKFTFICEHESAFTGETVSTITVESKRDRLDHILEDIEDFLSGCGYAIDGDLQIVNEEDELNFDFTNMSTTVSDDYFADSETVSVSIDGGGWDTIRIV